MLDDESEDYGSDSGYSSTCAFPFRFYNSVGCVSGMGSGFFVPKGVESNCDFVTFFVFVPIVVDPKGGQIIKIFWCPKSLFPLQISKSVLEL